MLCDSGRGNAYVIGGTNGSQRFADVWEWDGTDWQDRTPQFGPPARALDWAAPSMSWLNRAVIFGGLRRTTYYADTWLWDGGSSSMPAHNMFAQFAEADVWLDSDVTGVQATYVSGGTGYTAGGTQNGAELYIWDGGRWRDTAVSNSATADAPATLTWSTATDPEWSSYDAATRVKRIRRLFTGIERGISFAAAPRGTNRGKSTPAVIGSDYAEVRVSYRLTE